MEQLEQLREEGKAEFLLSEQGYVTWLRGNIYDGKVEGEEGVLAVVERTRDLLGLDEEAQFVKGVAWALGNNYTESGWVLTEDIGLGAELSTDISAAIPVAIQAGATTTLEPMAF